MVFDLDVGVRFLLIGALAVFALYLMLGDV